LPHGPLLDDTIPCGGRCPQDAQVTVTERNGMDDTPHHDDEVDQDSGRANKQRDVTRSPKMKVRPDRRSRQRKSKPIGERGICARRHRRF
jgi:hypothetical protein